MNQTQETLATYTLCVVVADPQTDAEQWDFATGRAHLQDQRILADLPAMLEAIEEDLTDLLPNGYKATITPQKGDSHA